MKHRTFAICALLNISGWSITSLWSINAAADGAYGRIAGDLAIQFDLGAGIETHNAMIVANGTFRYLQTAGIYTTVGFIPQGKARNGAEYRCSVAAGVELRPLFLPRFLKNMQLGTPIVDMLIDSFSIRIGMITWTADSIQNTHSRRPELDMGMGIGIPLSNKVSGLWLNTTASMRWSHYAIDQHKRPDGTWWITIGWQGIFSAGIVSAPRTL